MDPLDVAWHLFGFVMPAVGLGLLLSVLARLVWRRELRPVGWLRLALWACASSVLTLVGSLIVLGRDGTMASYVAMVLASALALWWAGFRRSKG